MDMMQVSSIGVITVICGLVVELVKATGICKKWLPMISGGAGMLLGMLAMFVIPSFPAEDFLTAAAFGIVSGLAATGANQVVKQLGKDEKGGN